MRKMKIDIPNLYLTEEEKSKINKNGEELAMKFRQCIHRDDEELNRNTISHDDTIYK